MSQDAQLFIWKQEAYSMFCSRCFTHAAIQYNSHPSKAAY